MIINCLDIRDNIIDEIRNNIKLDMNEKAVFLQVGNRADSNAYIKGKKALCDKVGIRYLHIQCEESITESELLQLIDKYNRDNTTIGIMVQLPLPKHINEESIINAIIPEKDIDGFTHINKGKLMVGDETGLLPCTPLGITKILEAINFNCKGKNVVVVGRSNIVGKPMTQLLINRGATVTCCNSNTPKETLKSLILNCDLFISALDKPWYFNVEYFGKDNINKLNNITAIDVGIAREDNRLKGNIDVALYDSFKAITPVPKGVGPMTVAGVIMNIIKCKEIQGGSK